MSHSRPHAEASALEAGPVFRAEMIGSVLLPTVVCEQGGPGALGAIFQLLPELPALPRQRNAILNLPLGLRWLEYGQDTIALYLDLALWMG